jgi:hypothetical protein
VEQAHEIQLLVGELAQFDCVLPNKFGGGGIIAKLPPTWRNFAMALKHKKEAMTVESLIATLDVEEKAKSKDVPRYGPMDSGTSNANVVEGKSVGKNKNKSNWKQKAKQNTDFKKKKNLADLTCFVCGEYGHIARKCRNRNGKKGDGQKNANRTTFLSVSDQTTHITKIWYEFIENRTPLLLSICFHLHRDSPHQWLLNVKHDLNSEEVAYQHPTIVFLNLQEDSYLIANSLCSFFSEQPNRKFCDADPDQDFIELNLVNRLCVIHTNHHQHFI